MVPNPRWFPFRAVPYGENLYEGKPREMWGWMVMSDNDSQEDATMIEVESEEIANWLVGVLNSADTASAPRSESGQ